MNNKTGFQKILGPSLLAIGAVIWGISFVSQSEGGEMGSFTFQTIRNFMAFASIGIAALVSDAIKVRGAEHKTAKEVLHINKTQIKAGVMCGVFLAIAVNLQQVGIDIHGKSVSAGRAGFLTALYIVLVPVLSVVLRKKITVKAWISVAIAVVGLYLISVKPGDGGGISTADLLLIGCALFFSFQIMTVDHYGDRVDGITLSCTEFLVAAILTLIVMLFTEKPDIKVINQNWGPLFYSGVMSGGVGYTLQILGQKHTKPVVASLIMSFESVFSALSDWIIRGNALNSREIAGCAIMFAAVILSQLPEFHLNPISQRIK